MRTHSLCGGFFVLSLLLAVSLSIADPDNVVEVVGTGECADCEENHFKSRQAFSGLHVSIDCKLKDGKIERVGFGELDDEGKFKVSIPQTLVGDGQKLKKECYAQLHNAGAVACPAHDGLEAAKIVFKSQTKGTYTFSPSKNLKFSAALCTSKFFWPIFKFPPLPFDPWKKHFHWFLPPPAPVYQPPVPVYKPNPPVPVYKPNPPVPVYKPKPPVYEPPVPVYKPQPPVPVYKPKPPVYKPPVPVYKPKPPVYKPPVPVYKPKPPVYKPKPPVYKPPVPVYKPKPPVYKPPPPVYKPKPEPPVYKPKPEPPVYKPKPEPPVYKPKPEPPVYKPKPEPPVYKPKPEPPVYKPKPEPPVYKPKPEPPVVTKPLPPPAPYYPPVIKKPLPPLPKLPPKYFNHPKFGHYPPLPPYHP
ncbi:hypothetical protein F511_07002 [Dorcoceras hygrometricum]|uniref:Proline-rich protein 4-like n=1 Tax=Dorcoceras hygrometricum TaxID=472368 RepID=A0A2Z7D2R5_9LAMI|nr:hypothetical protein F511_07002 [Dorcoceras hygrometricum]